MYSFYNGWAKSIVLTIWKPHIGNGHYLFGFQMVAILNVGFLNGQAVI